MSSRWSLFEPIQIVAMFLFPIYSCLIHVSVIFGFAAHVWSIATFCSCLSASFSRAEKYTKRLSLGSLSRSDAEAWVVQHAHCSKNRRLDRLQVRTLVTLNTTTLVAQLIHLRISAALESKVTMPLSCSNPLLAWNPWSRSDGNAWRLWPLQMPTDLWGCATFFQFWLLFFQLILADLWPLAIFLALTALTYLRGLWIADCWDLLLVPIAILCWATFHCCGIASPLYVICGARVWQ